MITSLSQDINSEYSEFQPVEIGMKKKSGDYVMVSLNEDTLIVRNKAGQVERIVQREACWYRLELIPSTRNYTVLKVKENGAERKMVLKTHLIHLRTIKEWMGLSTPERMRPVLWPLMRENLIFGTIWFFLAIANPSMFLWFVLSFWAFGLAAGAYHRPRPEWFLLEFVPGLFLLKPLFVGIPASPYAWVCIGLLAFAPLVIIWNGVRKYQLWKS